MALPDPKDLLKNFSQNIEKIRSTEPLSQSDRWTMADDLSEVYNYVSASSRKQSMTNLLYTVSARDAKLRQQLEDERQQLEVHRQFVEQNFDKADQYLKTIQAGGYAAFFAVWGFSKEWVDPFWTAL